MRNMEYLPNNTESIYAPYETHSWVNVNVIIGGTWSRDLCHVPKGRRVSAHAYVRKRLPCLVSGRKPAIANGLTKAP